MGSAIVAEEGSAVFRLPEVERVVFAVHVDANLKLTPYPRHRGHGISEAWWDYQ